MENNKKKQKQKQKKQKEKKPNIKKSYRVSLLNGRAAVVVTDKSPILRCYNTKKECVVVLF